MAIDDNTNYTLTGAQVKDLAARIKGAAGAVIYYVGETFFTDGATGESVYSDSALTTTVTATAMAAEAEAGKLLYLFELDSRNDVVSIHEISYVAPPGMDDGEFSVLYGTSIWDIFYVPGTGWSVNEQSIPTVNNATLTIQHNGTTVNTFTANASTNKTANVETIYADPIASSAAITPLVQTSMIADGAITTDKLGANAVTSAKVDWSTMEHWSIVLPGDKTVSNRGAYQYKDVPDGSTTINAVIGGVYLVLMNAAICCTTTGTDCYARVLLNDGNLILGSAQTTAANKFATVSGAQIFTATQSSNTLKIQLAGGTANSSYMIAGTVVSSVQIIRIA